MGKHMSQLVWEQVFEMSLHSLIQIIWDLISWVTAVLINFLSNYILIEIRYTLFKCYYNLCPRSCANSTRKLKQ